MIRKLNYIFIIFMGTLIVGCGGGSSGSNDNPPIPTPTPSPMPTISPDHNPGQLFDVTVQNLPLSVFVNKSYNVKFTFTNESTTSISLENSQINIPSPIVWTNQVDGCSNQTLAIGESCSISGVFNLPVANSNVVYSIKLASTGGESFTYTKYVVALNQYSGYLAVKFNSLNDTSRKMYITVVSGGDTNFVHFTAPNYLGTLTPYSSVDYSTNAIQVAGTGALTNVVYIPKSTNGAGGRIYVSLDQPLYGTTDPSISAPITQNLNTIWSTAEYYYDVSNPISNFDISNVNSISLPLNMSIVDVNTSDVNNIGIKYNPTIAASAILTTINESLASWPNSWAKLGSMNATNTTSLIAILSGANYLSAPNQNSIGFESSLFNVYTDDLWEYYENHDMQIDVTNISPGCYLTGRVDSVTKLLEFSPSAGAMCSEDATTGVNTFTMTKFTVYDYIGAAGNVDDTTYGPNGSYRSWVGETIVALQSMGFLPFCSQPNAIFSKNFVANQDKSLYYTPQYTCLTNYNTYKEEVINQYAYQSYLYFAYYGYGYGDWLGLDGDISNDAIAFPVTFTAAKW